MAYILLFLGIILLAYLFFLVRQWRVTRNLVIDVEKPVVPVNLVDNKNAVIVAEGRGRLVYINDHARDWFGLNGNEPNLTLMAQQVQPPETFRDVFAQEGRVTFRVGHRQVDAASHLIPGDDNGRRMVVVMREMASATTEMEEFDPVQAMNIIGEISTMLAQSFELENTLDSILQSIGTVIHYDSSEINAWQPEQNLLRPLARVGDPNYAAALDQAGGIYKLDEGYTGWIARYRQPLVIGDVNTRQEVIPKVVGYPFNSYVGVPLMAGDRFIGTLELASRERHTFDYEHMNLLQTLAGQVAVALENARLYREQSSRVAELSGLQQIAQAMAFLTDPSEMFKQLNTSLAKLMNVEMCGVMLLTDDFRLLVGQPPLYGVQDPILPLFKIGVEPGSAGYQVWHGNPWWYSNSAYNDEMIHRLNLQTLVDVSRMHSISLVPMIVGNNYIGAVLAANPRDGAGFADEDMHLLTVFAAQVAIVVENARLYNEEQRRAEELSGLQQIAQAMGALHEPGQLYSQINERIAELLNAKGCGVFLYDPETKALINQPPFYGFSSESIKFTPMQVEDGSLLQDIWQNRDYWFSNELLTDSRIVRTGLGQLASANGMQKGVLAVLTIGGQRLGILLVVNKLDGSDFDDDDARLLRIFSGQAAVLIDNSRLYSETRQRAAESEKLRRIAELVAGAVDINLVVKDVLQETAQLLSCDFIAVARLNAEGGGGLVYAPEYAHGKPLKAPFMMDIFSPGFAESVVLSRKPMNARTITDESRLLPAYMELAERVGLHNLLIVPLIIQNRSIGELTAANKVGGGFSESDQSLLQAVAAQIAAAIDRTRLYQATDADLRARLEELDALDRIGKELAESLDLDRIIEVTRSEVTNGTPATGVQITLLAPRMEWLDENNPLIEKRVGAIQREARFLPAEQRAYNEKRLLYINDYKGVDIPPMPETARSAIVEVMQVEGDTVGLIYAYSEIPDAFETKHREFVSRIAKQTSMALANARRYREQLRLNEVLRGRAEQLSKVYTLGQRLRQGAELQDVLEQLAQSLAENVGYRVVLINLLDETAGVFRRVAQYGVSAAKFKELQQAPVPQDKIKQLFLDKYKLGSTYFIQAEAASDSNAYDGITVSETPSIYATDVEGNRAWQGDDSFVVPIRTNENKIMGWISVDAPADGRRPSLATAESMDIFATEAAFIVENYQVLRNLRAEAAGSRMERERLSQLHKVAQQIQQAADIPARLNIVLNGIQATTGWQKVRITMRDKNLDNTLLVQAGYSEDEVRRLPATVLPGSVWRERLADAAFEETRLGAGYYLRYDHPWVKKNVFRGTPPRPESVPEDQWHPQDIVHVMLYGQSKQVVGILALEQPSDGKRPTESSLQMVELFGRLAADAIENTSLYLNTVRQEETEQRLTEMMEAVAASLDLETVIRTLADGLRHMIAFTRMHVALPSEASTEFGLRRVEVTGDQRVYLFDDKPVPMQNTAMGKVFTDSANVIYHLKTDKNTQNYEDLKRWQEQGESITLMVPMVAGGRTLGVLRLGSELENAFGFEEHLDLVGRMANLSAVSIDHSRLVDDLIASTAYNEAVVESIQQGIVVLNETHDIVSVNAFMRQRYGWKEEAVGQNLYTYQPDFKLFLEHSISTAIAKGKPQHQFEIQDTDAEGQKMIRNFYSYPLRQGDVVKGVVLLVEDVTERAILEADLAQRAEQLTALTRVSSQITSMLATDQVVSLVLAALDSVMPYDGVSLWLRDGKRLYIEAARGYKDPGAATAEELIGLYVELSQSILFEEMAANRQVINVGDTGANDPRFPYGEARVYKNWLGAPLVSQQEVIGVIALEKREPYFYRGYHEQLLLAFANQAAVAFSNARLFEETTSRAAELDAQTTRLALLNRVSVSLAQSLDIENILEITLRETAIALGIDEAVAIKIDHDNELGRVVVEFPRSNQEPNRAYPLAKNKAIARVRETLLPLVIDNVKSDILGEDVKPWIRREETTSVMIVPLVVGGTVIGAMVFAALDENSDFTSERVDLAQTLASQAAIAVQNASLFEQSVIRTHELETLFEAAQATAVTLDLEEAMRRVVNQMLSALRADACSIAIWDDIENKLEIREAVNAWGDADSSEPPGTIYDLSDYPVRERVLRQREVAVVRADQEDLHESERATLIRNKATDRILVPLVVNDFASGLIELEIREQNRYFEAADVRLARTLASQAAVAIENARLQTETRSHIEELYIINDLSTAVASTVKAEDLFPIVRDQLPVLTSAEILYVALYDPEQDSITFPVSVSTKSGSFDMPQMTMGDDEFSYVLKRKAPLLLAGATLPEARRSYGVTEPRLTDAKCFLGVPMMSGEQVVGVVAVQDNTNPRAFGLNDQRVLTTVASQLGVAIYNARLFTQTKQLADEMEKRVIERTVELVEEQRRVETLYEITSEVAASLDINRVLSRALEKVAQAIGANSAVILGIDEVSDRLYVLHAYGGLPVNNEMERTQLKQNEGLAGWVIQNRSGVVINDAQEDERWVKTSERDMQQRGVVAALLEAGDDVRGVMMLFSDKTNAFNDNHLKLVTAAASQLANSMSNAELYSLIRDQAERLGAILRAEQVESIKNAAILDSVADGVMYANEHGTIVGFNKAAERILGLPQERVVNRPITELTGLYGNSDWLVYIERWMGDPAAYRGDADFVEVLINLDDGRVVSVRLSPVNMGDQFLGTVSVFRDVTKMIEVDRLKTEFVATVSHELRTPMTSIKGYADLLLLGAAGEISEAQQRFLETIKQNADRLSILVNDLLEVSRIDQNSVPLRFIPVSVYDILSSVEDHLRGRIEDQKKPLEVEIKSEDNMPLIRADYDKIIQVMHNLVDNAFNYTHTGGTVTLGAHVDQEKPDTILMYVKDSGIGIPPEVGERIFERFFRGDELDDLVLDTPGTGLGLSIVKSLVEMHQGDIWFESELGAGSTFYVRVPVSTEDAQ